jgi:hypothetical protein
MGAGSTNDSGEGFTGDVGDDQFASGEVGEVRDVSDGVCGEGEFRYGSEDTGNGRADTGVDAAGEAGSGVFEASTGG